jgi:hypothetical protein
MHTNLAVTVQGQAIKHSVPFDAFTINISMLIINQDPSVPTRIQRFRRTSVQAHIAVAVELESHALARQLGRQSRGRRDRH